MLGAHQSRSVIGLSWTEGRKYDKRLKGRVEDREITQQLLSWVKQTELGDKLIKFITNQIRVG